MKRFLDNENIDYDDAADMTMLKGLAKRRMVRHAKDDMSIDARRNLFDLDAAVVSIIELKVKIADMKVTRPVKTQFKAGVAYICDIFDAETMIVLKHEVGNDATCRGNMRNGVCLSCGEHDPGVLDYSFKILMKDVNDESVTAVFHGGQSAGTALFDMPAREFNALSVESRKDAIEAVCETTKWKFKMWVSCKQDDVIVGACQFARA